MPESKKAMRVCLHSSICLLCVVTLLFHPYCPIHAHKNHAHSDHSHSHTPDGLQTSQVGGSSDPPTSNFGLDEALSEQRFYIQQLFRRYGQQDRLDFGGFQNLLLSLGLGQVRLLDLEHEDLGHDHVAHLDILQVQDGHHTHRPSHSYGHQQSHSHSEEEDNWTSIQPPPCRPNAIEATEGPKVVLEDPSHEDDHIQDLGHKLTHGLKHDNSHDHSHDHNHRHKNNRSISDSTRKQSKPQQNERHRHPQHHKVQNGRESNIFQPLKPQNSSGQQKPEQHPSPVPQSPDTRNKKPRKSSKRKGVHSKTKDSTFGTAVPLPNTEIHGSKDATTKAEDHQESLFHQKDLNDDDHEHSDHGHDHEYEHDNQHKEGRIKKRAAPDEPCLNLTQLLHYYGLSPDTLISPTQFTYLCPALLYQIDSRVCIRHYHNVDIQHSALEPSHSVWTWVWGFVSITVISLLSLLGVVLVPIINQSCFKFLLTFLVALAVGTLSGDALLHLLPHSQGEHDHSHPSETNEKVDLVTAFDGVWKGLTALAGIYLLFIIEHCIGMFKHYREQGGRRSSNQTKVDKENIDGKIPDHQPNRRSDAEWMSLKSPTVADSSASSCDSKHDTELTQCEPESTSHQAKIKKHGHSHGHSHCHSDQEMKDAGIASIAWMVIMGDGMHNFSDGLAIGAAFSANVTGGISTSVAVFCHELPHELGDFAVLLKAGMSVKQAIAYNLLSALMAYVGMLIGTAVGQYTYNVTSWIFAATAGMFLYVALVDMLPEMLHGDSEDHKRCQLGHFLLQNLGVLSGFAIMLLIAIFEEHIVLDLGF
ncbi:Zinc transporter ZIP10-like [Scleropages formosus]|uniref:Zinc transporter ZIP10-like n=1 Tax=Scleropages formosus TaxID=113540 RepID=A0A0P7V5I7_SCLFO|nr:Zinc transporter ZIP10-like [Scleropages formosus]